MKNLLHQIHIRRLRQNFEELMRLYTKETGKAANEVLAIDVLQWIK